MDWFAWKYVKYVRHFYTNIKLILRQTLITQDHNHTKRVNSNQTDQWTNSVMKIIQLFGNRDYLNMFQLPLTKHI
jgi:hypothetical protein